MTLNFFSLTTDPMLEKKVQGGYGEVEGLLVALLHSAVDHGRYSV